MLVKCRLSIVVSVFWLLMLSAGASEYTRPDVMTFSAIENNQSSNAVSGILEQAYGNLGIDVNILRVPAGRGLKLSSSGQVDGEVARIAEVGQKYPSLQRVDVPLYVSSASIFAKSGNAVHVLSPADLKNQQVLCIRGILASEFVATALEFSCVYAKDQKQALDMLIHDRVSMILGSQSSIELFLGDFKEHNITPVLPDIYQVKLYHYVHQKHQALVPDITQALEKLGLKR